MATTALSIIALPGKPHSFLAKGTGPHTGLFTSLSVLSIPGRRLTFIAKGEVIVVPPEPTVPTPAKTGGMRLGVSSVQMYEERKDILRDDKDLMEFIGIILASGILDT